MTPELRVAVVAVLNCIDPEAVRLDGGWLTCYGVLHDSGLFRPNGGCMSPQTLDYLNEAAWLLHERGP